MCDYSLQSVKSRPAKVGDKLTTRNFGTGTRGFAASEDASVAVCVLPGTELSPASPHRLEDGADTLDYAIDAVTVADDRLKDCSRFINIGFDSF